MDTATKRPPHRIRKGWDCPHCGMHFGWKIQFIRHPETCEKKPAKTVAIGLRYSR